MSIQHVAHDRLLESVRGLFLAMDMRRDVAAYFSEGICQNSLRGIDSHGVRLVPHYARAIESGRLNRRPTYRFEQNTASTGRFDADHAPGHAAGSEAMQRTMDLATQHGIGAVSVFNSTHFGAAAFYGLRAAENGMIGLSFTNATAHIPPNRGVRPFFGNNPVCLCAPVAGEEPFCFDMATTVSTFNKVQKYKEEKKDLPAGWCADDQGRPTTDAQQAYSLLPIGAYKGFGLSMMVEILCGLLGGMPYGPDVTAMFGDSLRDKRYLGHFFVAIDVTSFQDLESFKMRMKEMMDALRSQKSLDPDQPVQCPGDPEKRAKRERIASGIPVPSHTVDEINDWLRKFGLPAI